MKTLLVIDMQNDFINGALGTKEAEAIVPVSYTHLDMVQIKENRTDKVLRQKKHAS